MGRKSCQIYKNDRMMKNILLISTIYPLPDATNKGTKVCHFFAKEWVKMGYNVRVVHYQAVFPLPFYWISKLFRNRIAAKTGAVVYTERDKGASFVMDNVPITRIPLFKPIPHGKFSENSIRKSIKQIINQNEKSGFIPDVIIGHFPNPQIEVLGRLKDYYSQAKTCMVMHGDLPITKSIYGERLPELMKKIDMWGFRSKYVAERFAKVIAPVNNPFVCYSGVPDSYITTSNQHDYSQPLKNFVYVGEMIERKYPSQILDALHQSYPNGNFHMSYVGDGQQIEVIEQKVEKYGLQNNVSIWGRIPRDEIKAQYDNADCMVMISCAEAYGLVYLEAMARGCITIASRNEGFDGVIEDGVNGFLCNAGDYNELSDIIDKINAMDPEERQKISERALETAKRLTDYKAAELYINDVIKRM